MTLLDLRPAREKAGRGGDRREGIAQVVAEDPHEHLAELHGPRELVVLNAQLVLHLPAGSQRIPQSRLELSAVSDLALQRMRALLQERNFA